MHYAAIAGSSRAAGIGAQCTRYGARAIDRDVASGTWAGCGRRYRRAQCAAANSDATGSAGGTVGIDRDCAAGGGDRAGVVDRKAAAVAGSIGQYVQTAGCERQSARS